MCGLIGGNIPNLQYSAAVSVLRHRGPDSQQVLNFGQFTIGFTRLAVVDTSAAADQPMLSDDGRVCLTFNGEIYGHRTIRSELQRRGHQFKTLSDTEVVLRAWLEWGPDFVDHIDGMFAIAIFDRLDDQVHLYRDRAGIKPLYYLWDGRNFVFASELKAIERLGGDLTLRVDNTALYDFLTYGYIPAPKSLYRNVYKLPPATHMVFDVGEHSILRTRRYWELPTEQRATANIEEVAQELKHHMQQSVSEQLVADVPVGCFLSGGIDSSIVVATADACMNQLQTFSVGFDVAEHSETAFAREVAARFDTDHREITFYETDAEDQLAQLKNLYDEPFADTSAFPVAAVSRCARQSVTVALSGDGGDELFGGYKWYRRYASLLRLGATRVPGSSAWFERAKHRLPTGGWLRKLVGAAAFATADELSLYVSLMGGMTKSRKTAYADLLEIDSDYDDCWYFRQHWRRDLPLLTRLQYLDFHTYLPDDILTKVDRASMAHSLEVRVPFLSRQLIEFAFSLPEGVRYHGNRLKGLLKHAYQQILPSGILSRPKKGFSTPPSHVYSFGGRLRETILARNHNVPPDANCLPVRFDHSVAQSKQHPGDADVQRLRQRRA
ncbi:MAG: asparagine synthase (glutamine-hydrolyzing) [Planctomycetaceae bacterium]|jgi:asparagine synthase (glutamine-hydrolysing)